ncbi:hypothetical protein B0J18DRAFT_427394 [Chaetomium sp. MPI-SDFR-AT-0129]|nr:hypothetical protein B0J18DRAFT_427394 [Chaetomium sp. MPI-SDFR-AT-0129]
MVPSSAAASAVLRSLLRLRSLSAWISSMGLLCIAFPSVEGRWNGVQTARQTNYMIHMTLQQSVYTKAFIEKCFLVNDIALDPNLSFTVDLAYLLYGRRWWERTTHGDREPFASFLPKFEKELARCGVHLRLRTSRRVAAGNATNVISVTTVSWGYTKRRIGCR